ncbi:hypothetical protein [Trichocoleus sp. FACHB-262]|uniref:hypothetical protein n=1 Tax=Trichocoleus sp. FACHB-262 TaxID=2692869 RepID=UPI001688C88B|nr:hypothetical protein [Trichocoleus sp. FACHB-262]MBD2122893.1 hypothetical protein [Trichocoleus sp. FACHB-262]
MTKQIKGTQKPLSECSQGSYENLSGSQLDFILTWFAIFCNQRFLYAKAKTAKGKPAWLTANRKEALTPQQFYERWKKPSELIGVRFWKKTQYFVLDIDYGSKYHPARNREAIAKILEALELIGLCRCLRVCSSSSRGLHIYFPLPDEFVLWKVALLVRKTLDEAGFEVQSGQLEIFPNYIPYIPDHKPEYNGHRLPLQAGSYLLNEEWQEETNNLEAFITRWHLAASGQDLEMWQRSLSMVKPPNLSAKDGDVQEWRDRLETTLKTGWTAKRQTQAMVKAACAYGRVFRGLSWCEVKTFAIETLTRAPGYRTFCGHQRNIKRVVRDWIKTNRKSNHYHPLYSRQNNQTKAPTGPSNQQKQQQAEQKIRDAIAQIVTEDGRLPDGNTARVKRLHAISRCSQATIYKYQFLWDSQHSELCVIPLSEGDPADSAIAEVLIERSNLSVIAQPERDSGVCNPLYKEPQIKAGQGITDNHLLSIYSSSASSKSSEVCAPPPTASGLHLQPEKKPISTALENGLIEREKLRVGSLVRQKKTGELFEFRSHDKSGRAWLKRKQQFAPSVACPFPLSEFEPYQQETCSQQIY